MPPLISADSAPTAPTGIAPRSNAIERGGRAILIAGLLAGVLDLTFALIWFGHQGRAPDQLLKSIAGGALGPGAFAGGAGSVALGVVFHFSISLGAAAVYYIASRYFSALNKYAWISGLIYGLLVYEFMHLVVLPLSAYHRPVKFPPLFVADVLSHLFFVGCAIALVVRYFGSNRTSATASGA